MAMLGEGEAELGIATANEQAGASSPFLAVRICDNGSGIAGSDLPNIFDPFFTTKEAGRGTGLGLYVCHIIMERLGGSIAVLPRSSGAGVEVKLLLPLSPSK